MALQEIIAFTDFAMITTRSQTFGVQLFTASAPPFTRGASDDMHHKPKPLVTKMVMFSWRPLFPPVKKQPDSVALYVKII